MYRPAGSALIAFTAACALAACASSGAVSTTAPRLAWEVSAPTSATYVFADTSQMAMDAGGMQVHIDAGTRITTDIEFVPAAAGLDATVRVTAVEGSIRNSAGPTITLTPADVPGPARIAVTRTGDIDVTQRPEMSPTFQRIGSTLEMYRRLFVPLPGGTVTRGTAWTDTIPLKDTAQGMTVESSTVVTSAWERDTTVAGRQLMVITSRSTWTTSVSGQSEGIQVEQQYNGTSSAVTLWDPAGRQVVERRETSDATGTTNLPGMGITGLQTTLRSISLVRRTN